MVATFIKAARPGSPGGSLSDSRSLPCCSFSRSAGSSPNHLAGSSRSAAKKKLVTSSADSEVRLVQTLARPKPSSRMCAISQSLNVKLRATHPTLLCFSVSALVNYILAVVFSSSSGCR